MYACACARVCTRACFCVRTCRSAPSAVVDLGKFAGDGEFEGDTLAAVVVVVSSR